LILIAHVSDTHLDTDERSTERTRAVMAHLEDLHDLDAVLITGDVTDPARPDEYELARELFASRHPVMVCPGNHDDRDAFLEFLLRQPGSTAPINQVRRVGDAVVALCDSSVPGKDEGLLEEETLAWLAQVLAEAPGTTPILVGFHHLQTLPHEPFTDGIRQSRAERLAALTDRRPNLAAFLCGHALTAAATTFAGRPLMAPGVVSTLRLPWERRAHPQDFVHLDQPPALAFHILDDTGRLTTHYRCVLT
jgi:Icc protein